MKAINKILTRIIHAARTIKDAVAHGNDVDDATTVHLEAMADEIEGLSQEFE